MVKWDEKVSPMKITVKNKVKQTLFKDNFLSKEVRQPITETKVNITQQKQSVEKQSDYLHIKLSQFRDYIPLNCLYTPKPLYSLKTILNSLKTGKT